MDSLITAAARALAMGDPLGALNRVALRDDAPALALRGIAMAQIGDLERAKALVRRAARAFGPREAVARARCAVVEAEIALASRDLAWPAKALTAASDILEAHGDRVNAAHARYLEVRRLVLIGRLDEAEHQLAQIDLSALTSALRAIHELVLAGISMRRVRAGEAHAALARAEEAARWAQIPALAAEVEQAFAVQEGAAFVNGDGSNKPTGFLHYDTVANASWVWGKLGHVLTGVDGGFPASDPSDVLVDLIYALKAGYRQNGSFVMNRKTQAAVRKFKDEGGNYLWQPPAQAGGRASLMTFPVVEAEDMPDIDDDSLSVAFGDFGRGYLVVDRAGVRVLRDPFTAKPYVLFYTTKRVGGGVQDFDAIKVLKFAAA